MAKATGKPSDYRRSSSAILVMAAGFTVTITGCSAAIVSGTEAINATALYRHPIHPSHKPTDTDRYRYNQGFRREYPDRSLDCICNDCLQVRVDL